MIETQSPFKENTVEDGADAHGHQLVGPDQGQAPALQAAQASGRHLCSYCI